MTAQVTAHGSRSSNGPSREGPNQVAFSNGFRHVDRAWWSNQDSGQRHGNAKGIGDLAIWGAALALAVIGLLAIYSATRGVEGDQTYLGRQFVFLACSLVLAIGISRCAIHRLAGRGGRSVLLALTLIAFGAVLTPLGVEQRGTRGWLRVFGFSFQPAELGKVTLILVLAALLAGRSGRARHRQIVAGRFLAAMMTLAALSALVLAGGETGSVLVYGVIVLTMMAGADVPKRLIGLLCVSILALGSLALTADVLRPYQRDRIESFLDLTADPEGSGYHQRQSLAAIGSGGLAGKGLFNGPQTQLRFLPEQHTDFIFAVVGEEFGFIGGLGILLLNGLLLARLLALARPRGDRFGELLSLGVFAYLGSQVVQNVAMNLRLLPVTGIPLPFVSYGGSSLVTSFVAVGLVQSVARSQRPTHGGAGRLPPVGQSGTLG